MATASWRAFWDRGGWWKALLAAAAYIVLYQLIGLAVGFLPGAAQSTDEIMSSTTAVILQVVVPPLLGAVILLVFARSLGWLPDPLFGRQPVSGRPWMWIGPGLVAVAAIFHFIGTDYSPYSASLVVADSPVVPLTTRPPRNGASSSRHRRTWSSSPSRIARWLRTTVAVTQE